MKHPYAPARMDLGRDRRWLVGFGLWLLAGTSLAVRASTVDAVVAAEMKNHGIIGVSIAVIEQAEIRQAKG